MKKNMFEGNHINVRHTTDTQQAYSYHFINRFQTEIVTDGCPLKFLPQVIQRETQRITGKVCYSCHLTKADNALTGIQHIFCLILL